MKKFLKRTVSAGLAVSMALMPCFPVFADTANPVVAGTDEEGKCSIAVEGAVEGHKYKVYQIFTGSAGADGTTLGNVKYGAVYGEEAGKSVPASVLEGIKDAKGFAKSIKDKLTGTPAAILTKENASAETEPGYYVIVDTVDGEMAAGDAVSDFIVATAGTVTFKPKATTVPTLDKKIDAETDSEISSDNLYSTAPAEEYIKWNYTLDDTNNIITLNQYIGSDVDVIVYSKYIVNGKEYTTNLKDNPHGMFNSSNLSGTTVQSIIFSDTLDTENVTTMYYLFGGLTDLESVDFGKNFNTSNVTNMCGMFNAAGKLKKINFGNGFDTSNVANMSSMFSNCTSLTDINFNKNFNTENVTDMNNMFTKCSALTTLDLSQFNTGKVANMQSMFYLCSSLENINLSSFNTENTSIFNFMFHNCSALKSINLKSFVTKNDFSSVTGMFMGCNNLETIYVTKSSWEVSLQGELGDCIADDVTYIDETASVQHGSSILPQAMAETNSIAVAGSETSVKYGKGDAVPFSLTATMPEFSKGFDYDETSFNVYVDGKKVDASAYGIKFSDDKKSFSLSIDDAKAGPFNAVAGTEIVVQYKAVLNEDADGGNTNDASLEYSNDPNGEGTGTTEPGKEDIVTVFTFSVAFDKVDGDGNALSGAGFTLYKKGEDGSYNEFTEEIKDTTSFNFNGLATGDYKLVESTTPDGYNTMEDLYFSIVAESDKAADGTSKITSLKIVDAEGNTLDGWTADADALSFTSDIANYTGATLPSTGGTGMAVFYVAGGMLVLAASVVAVSKKKAKEGQE